MLSCALSIEGLTGEEDSRWLRRHAAKEDGYRFACDVIAGKTTNPSNWPYFRLGLFCASTRCSHWYEHWFGDVHFRRHWVVQLPRPRFTLRDYTRSRICEANAHETTSRGGFTDAHRRQCASECERSNPHRMRITGTVWTGLKCLNIHCSFMPAKCCKYQLHCLLRWHRQTLSS